MDKLVGRGWAIGILLAILASAATLRLAKLDQVPPALHVDEASNAWNAYTLLKTGKDQHGVSWPIFYARAFGENRSASYIYALIPFQAVGGMNEWTTRLPSAIGGILTVLLIYFVGARLFGSATGLAAAAMLAVNPWHVQTTRLGLEAALSPLLIVASLAAFLWADLPLDDDRERRPRPVVAALAGATAGISCYGYWAVRLFLPVFLIGAVIVTWKAWWSLLKNRAGSHAILALVIAAAVTAGPLFWKHLTDPEIHKRGQIAGWVWNESDTVGEKIGKALSRYPGHIGPDFLFISGDKAPDWSPPKGTGLFYWYELPLMLVGLITTLSRARSSRAARLLLVWLIFYPVADLLNEHPTSHSLRSLPGLGGLILLGAVGAVAAGGSLWQRRRTTLGICSAMAVLALILNVRFFREFFGDDFYRQKYSLAIYANDLLEATRWLRPRLNEIDAAFITGYTLHPDIVTLVGLSYDPQQWFRDIREVVQGPFPDGRYKYEDVYVRYGKIRFLFGGLARPQVEALLRNGRPDHVVFIVRPGELRLEKFGRPAYEVRDPRGRTVLQIFDLYL
jgi:4-amino-4-deoxy-L-arabinose transferase-like glycosyltransferase